MTKQQEKDLFKLVNERFWKFGSWEPSDTPDILVKKDNQIIGIEITQVTRKSRGEIIAARYSLEDELASMISKALNESPMETNLHCIIDFKPDIYISSNQKLSFCNRVASAIITFAKSLDKNAWSINHHIDQFLPEEINWISYDCYPFSDKSDCYPSRGKKKEFLKAEDVLATIAKKEEKLQSYLQKCDKVRLLIIEGLLPASWIGQLREPIQEIDSGFEEVVMFHYHGLKGVKLK